MKTQKDEDEGTSHDDGRSGRRRPVLALDDEFSLEPETVPQRLTPHPQERYVQTPSLAETYSEIKRNLSFETLPRSVSAENLRSLRHAVWRRGGRNEPGEERFRPSDLERVVVHSVTGGFRSLVLACALRANVNWLSLVLERVLRRRKITLKLLLHALFGPDTLRFGGMMGLFVLIYRFTLHFLRITNPFRTIKNKEEPYHAAIAGFLSGFSVLAEKRSRRITLGQQMLVRGLQGQYNRFKHTGRFHLPHGDVLLFGVSCANIMYAWLMAPEALAPGYRRWVTNASRVPPGMLPVNLSLTRSGIFDPLQLEQVLFTKGKKAPTPASRLYMEGLIESVSATGHTVLPMADCPIVHPWIDSCKSVSVDRFLEVFRFMLPVYGALHVIPPVLLRFSVFKKRPVALLSRSVVGTLRSCAFLAFFVTWFQGLVCLQRNVYKGIGSRTKNARALRDIIGHRYYYYVLGFSTALSLFIEEKKRRGELAMYVLPKGLEVFWFFMSSKLSLFRIRGVSSLITHGDVLLNAVGLSMVMSIYHHHPHALSGLVRSILYQFVGHS